MLCSISAVQQEITVIQLMYSFILFHYGLSLDIDYSSRLCGRIWLVIHSVFTSLHLLTQNSNASPSPLTSWQPQVCSLRLWRLHITDICTDHPVEDSSPSSPSPPRSLLIHTNVGEGVYLCEWSCYRQFACFLQSALYSLFARGILSLPGRPRPCAAPI